MGKHAISTGGDGRVIVVWFHCQQRKTSTYLLNFLIRVSPELRWAQVTMSVTFYEFYIIWEQKNDKQDQWAQVF